ncbi:monooxygenase [Saxophila tyrrhenica]|uniref:Monooxygenase n=1 Tax=Saxophila tyrrhenica TaxID=1690608 RepID=A0AAV9PK54_9PEZI|nr:monooxygenase [Saxophila tyrrhenica]
MVGARDNNCKVRSICIVGAGPSGLAAAKYFIAEEAFDRIVLFEQRDNVGGLWNHLPRPEAGKLASEVPQTDPNGGYGDGSPEDPLVCSPIYDLLETNIPRGLMGFSDQEWPSNCQLFPNHKTVLRYLEDYAQDVLHLIRFNNKVLDITQTSNGRWLIESRKTTHDQLPNQSETFDAVLVASGHFDVPYIPSVSGITAWHDTYPGSITHSKFYRHPSDFADRKVVVVGNSASGQDIANQVRSVSRKPLLQSSKAPAQASSASKLEKPPIVKYETEGRCVHFADGTVETNVDSILYCTGYFYSYPFLRSLQPPVITSGEYVENLYQHMFYRPRPTLAFAALNQKIIPFPVAEAQCSMVSGVWAGRLRLPEESEMRRWEQRTLEDTGGGRNFHVLKFPKDADYINMLHDWAMNGTESSGESCARCKEATPCNGAGKAAVGKGTLVRKEPPYWTEKEYWTRERFPEIKKAFQAFDEERHTKRSLEEVGFDFAKYKGDRWEWMV